MGSARKITLIFCIGFVAACLGAAAQQNVNYIYDELGRLVGVIDPSGNAAAYHYDAVGNLLSISRDAASQVSIIEFTRRRVGQSAPLSRSGVQDSARRHLRMQ